MKLLSRYNEYYNDVCSGLPHGGPISIEHLQATTIRAVLYAFARKYNMTDKIYVEDLELLANQIEEQGNEFIKRTETPDELAQDPSTGAPDAL